MAERRPSRFVGADDRPSIPATLSLRNIAVNLLLLLSALLSALSGVAINDARGDAPVARSRALGEAVAVAAPAPVRAARPGFAVAPSTTPPSLIEPAVLRLVAAVPLFASRRRE